MVTIIKAGSSGNTIQKLLGRLRHKKGLNAKKHSGVIKLKKSPTTIQQELRNEWE